MKIGIHVPSRERMNRRLTLLTSIITSVNDINNVNVYFGVDEDDPTRKLIYKVADAIPCVKIINIKNDGKFLGLGKMWNQCVNESDDEIISMIGDDMVFHTPGWDNMIIEEFSGNNIPGDQIKAIHCNDDCHGAKLAVNLFCHRKFNDVMGQFMREEFKINWVDQWLHQVFSAFGRLKYRGDIMIEHRHWVLGKAKPDVVAERMAVADKDKVSDKLWHDLVDERIKDVQKLSNYLGIEPDWSVVDTQGRCLK
jgi:hypothetical protein